MVRSQPLSGTTMCWGEQPNGVVHDRSANENTVALQTSDRGGGAGGTPVWAFVFWGFEACYCRTTGKSLRNQSVRLWNVTDLSQSSKRRRRNEKNSKNHWWTSQEYTFSRQCISGKQISFADFYKKLMWWRDDNQRVSDFKTEPEPAEQKKILQ